MNSNMEAAKVHAWHIAITDAPFRIALHDSAVQCRTVNEHYSLDQTQSQYILSMPQCQTNKSIVSYTR